MKKLLSLLSIVTITGSVMPTLISASSYKNQENNKLETLKRNKIQSTTTPIPGTVYYLHNDEVRIENSSNWGNNFVLRIGRQAAQTLSQLTTAQNLRDGIGALVAALGFTGAIWDGGAIALSLGIPIGVGSLLVILLNRWNENPQAFRNLFRSNDISNGLNLAVNEDPVNQLSIWTTSASGSLPW